MTELFTPGGRYRDAMDGRRPARGSCATRTASTSTQTAPQLAAEQVLAAVQKDFEQNP